MSEKRHRTLTIALALTAALCLTVPASALPVGSAAERGVAAWTLDSIFDWFQSFFAARWTDRGDGSISSASPEKLGSIGGGGTGAPGGIGGSTGNGGSGSTLLPDGSPGAGSP